MPDPIAPTVPVTPAAPAAVAPAVAAPSATAPAQTPAAALATPDKPAAAPSPDKPAEPAKRPDSLIPDPEAKPADGDKPAAATAPEKYEAFKLPEGVTIAAEGIQQFEAFAKEEGLSQDRAQKYLDRHVAEIKKMNDGIYQTWYDTQRTWQAEITADKSVGGEKLPASKQAIGRVLNFLGPELGKSFREALDFTGAGNNPAVFRSLVKLAERFSEATPVSGKPGSTAAPRTAASVLYPPKG